MNNLLGDQPQAFEKLQTFINQNEFNIFKLFGSAGTGKSTVIALFILDLIKNKYYNNNVYFLASTNKAVKVLKQKTNFLENKNITFQTIDKFLNCIERIDEFGRTYFCPKDVRGIFINNKIYYIDDTNNAEKIKAIKRDKEIIDNPLKYCTTNILNFVEENDIVIIDECSMLSDDKWNIIKYFCKGKIVCMGDKNQLEPITDQENSNIQSIIFDDYDTDFSFELMKILRTEDSDIHKIYEVTRNFIAQDLHPSLSEVCAELRKCNVNKTGIKDNVIKHIKEYLENDEDFVVLSYRNKSVNEFSKIIDECLEDTKIKKYGYFLNTKYIMKTHYSKNLTNNTEFEIFDVIKENNQYILKIITENKQKLDLIIFDKPEYEKMTSSIISNINKLKKFSTIKSLSEKKNIRDFAENIINEEPSLMLLYKDIIEGAIIKLKQDLRTCIMKNEEIFCLCYSLTIHKSQEQTSNYCIINLRDIYDTRMTTLQQKARLLYVASTRASKGILYFI
jgi:hypothetical protein